MKSVKFKNPIYRKWYSHEGFKMCYAKILPNGAMTIVEMMNEKVRTNEEVSITYTIYHSLYHSKRIKTIKKSEFNKMFELAIKKVKYGMNHYRKG